MNGFPVQPAKVQRPPLRDETLARDRLLDWLHVKIHHRLVLVLAEAGYGKTTLLADFAGRTRLRTLWYRLDEDDRDWVTLLHHLVASGREHDGSFAPRTSSMLADGDVSGPTRDAVLDMFLRELGSIAEHGAALILDDLHLVDDSADVKVIVRELIARAPERLSIVILSRRSPSISVAKLRAAGEVAELRTDELRFDPAETARLFSETYGRPLEADVLADLSARTEGWAASLQLVQAALRDRSPGEIRRFVRNLTGADQELYDYLAEEVVGDLPDELQRFLMQTALLQVVTPQLATAITGLPLAQVRTLTGMAERFSLLSRRGSTHRDHLRYHPLVRGFLEARLERSVADPDDVRALHRAVAAATEGHDWRVACHHYAQIDDQNGIVRTIDAAVEEIVARGDVLVAESYLVPSSDEPLGTALEVIRSRADIRRGDYSAGLARAIAANLADPGSAVALANLASVAYRSGELGIADSTARVLAEHPTAKDLRAIGDGLRSLIRFSVDGSVADNVSRLRRLREAQRARGHSHHEGTTLLNMAVAHRVAGECDAVLQATSEALPLLEEHPASAELAATLAVRAWALAHGGDIAAAREAGRVAVSAVDYQTRLEVLLEMCELEIWFGSLANALDLLDEVGNEVDSYPSLSPLLETIRVHIAIRSGDLSAAQAIVDAFDFEVPTIIGGNKAQKLALAANVARLAASPNARELSKASMDHARRQGAGLWLTYGRLTLASLDGADSLNRETHRLGDANSAYLSMQAELLLDGLPTLDNDALRAVQTEVQRRPERWLPGLRALVDEQGAKAAIAARMLESAGTVDDVPRLRRLSRKRASGAPAELGRELARRVAPKLYVEDQGRVALRLGDRHIEGAAIRRKVLSLLCLLLTRPRFSATRDEVLEALWPDFEPAVALNSLNQTLYFLRRVLEPGYREDLSAGYVRHESDVVWLDRQLVSSRSQRCSDLIRALPANPGPEEVELVARTYEGMFALDFAYEDWAVGYRESQHASYLQVIEGALASDIASGHFDRGVSLARRALSVDPTAEQIELSLLHLLRAKGAHAAAAEQYEHYAASVRENLGIEPPPLESL